MNPWDVFGWAAAIGLTVIVGIISLAMIIAAVKGFKSYLKEK